MSPSARLMCGIALILIPTIVYGGLTVLYVISNGKLGPGGPRKLTPDQVSFYRAGHAHAGVLTVLALVVQIVLDYVALSPELIWVLRICVIAAALFVSGGFFAVAHVRALRGLLYLGAFLVAATTLMAGIGLLRTP
jgi:hypothetical protein